MSINTNISPKQLFSPCPAGAVRTSAGDGAPVFRDVSSVLAVAKLEGAPGNIYYYSTTFSGGTGVSTSSGVFDVPKDKCPPDILGGSSGCVTGSQASPYTPPTPSPSPPNYFTPRERVSTNRQHRALPLPVTIPARPAPLPSPPATPSPASATSPINPLKARSSTLEFLAKIFPRSAVTLLPHTRSVQIMSSQEGMNVQWDGAVLALPGKERAFYVDGVGVENVHLKECVVALLELADEHLHCTSLVIALSKSSPDLGEVIHALMYVGGTVVSRPPFSVGKDYILVGISL